MKKKEITLSQLVNKIERLNKNLENLHIGKRYSLDFKEEDSMYSYCIRHKQDMLDVLDLFIPQIEYCLKTYGWEYYEDCDRYEITFVTNNNSDCPDRKRLKRRRYYISIQENIA